MTVGRNLEPQEQPHAIVTHEDTLDGWKVRTRGADGVYGRRVADCDTKELALVIADQLNQMAEGKPS